MQIIIESFEELDELAKRLGGVGSCHCSEKAEVVEPERTVSATVTKPVETPEVAEEKPKPRRRRKKAEPKPDPEPVQTQELTQTQTIELKSEAEMGTADPTMAKEEPKERDVLPADVLITAEQTIKITQVGMAKSKGKPNESTLDIFTRVLSDFGVRAVPHLPEDKRRPFLTKLYEELGVTFEEVGINL